MIARHSTAGAQTGWWLQQDTAAQVLLQGEFRAKKSLFPLPLVHMPICASLDCYKAISTAVDTVHDLAQHAPQECISRTATISERWNLRATSTDFSPILFRRLVLIPGQRSSSKTTGRWPNVHAACRGETPSLEHALARAPACSSSRTMCELSACVLHNAEP